MTPGVDGHRPRQGDGVTLTQLRRIRWGVRVVLILGIVASVTANVLHANPNLISQVIAAWPPCALLLTVELISRVPVHRRSLAVIRLAATATIACIAAWVSYWHMAGVAARYGESGAAQYLIPFSVDGLVVVASVCLVELAGRIASAESPQVSAPIQAQAQPVNQPVIQPVIRRPEPSVLSMVTESEEPSRAIRADDEDLIQAVRDDALKAIESGELIQPDGSIGQRPAVRLIESVGGVKVGQRRAVRIIEAIRDDSEERAS